MNLRPFGGGAAENAIDDGHGPVSLHL
jgi:hypothetical protein